MQADKGLGSMGGPSSISLSSNGRTSGSEPENGGSSPSEETKCQWCGGSGWQAVPFVGGYPEPCAMCNPEGIEMGGRGAQVKGATFERDCVNDARAYNIPTERTGHAQTSEHSTAADIAMKIMGVVRAIECKIGQQTPKCMYKWIREKRDNWAVLHRRDREEALITLRYRDFLKLVHAAAYGKLYSEMNMPPNIKSEEEVDAE